jgi:hypothetical protein
MVVFDVIPTRIGLSGMDFAGSFILYEPSGPVASSISHQTLQVFRITTLVRFFE